MRDAAGGETVIMKQCRQMQWNPGKQKLTDRLFRGFWIRERAHFHPVGQSPGGKCRRTKRVEAGRESSGHKNTVSER